MPRWDPKACSQPSARLVCCTALILSCAGRYRFPLPSFAAAILSFVLCSYTFSPIRRVDVFLHSPLITFLYPPTSPADIRLENAYCWNTRVCSLHTAVRNEPLVRIGRRHPTASWTHHQRDIWNRCLRHTWIISISHPSCRRQTIARYPVLYKPRLESTANQT